MSLGLHRTTDRTGCGAHVPVAAAILALGLALAGAGPVRASAPAGAEAPATSPEAGAAAASPGPSAVPAAPTAVPAPTRIPAEEPRPGFASDDSLPESSDWIQLSSREWLRGEVLAMYDGEIEFDSSEFDVETYDWEDVREVRTYRPMEVRLTGGEVLLGRLVVIGNRTIVFGAERREVPKGTVIAVTRSVSTRLLRRFAMELGLGLTVRQGNVDQIDGNLDARLRRRTVDDRLMVDYDANFSETEGTVTAHSQIVRGDWDHFVSERVFITPVGLEWQRDPIQNLSSRTTVGAGAGYKVVVTPRTDWEVSAGLGYQQVRYDDVEVGTGRNEDTVALGASTTFEQERTKAVDFTFDHSLYFVNDESGRYHHHLTVSVETDWTEMLALDVSVVWDRVELPRPDDQGLVPEQDDLRMVVSLQFEL
jgi:hypothetical protein